MGTPGCVNKRAWGNRVCGRFRSKYAYGQQERPQLHRIGTVRVSASPTMVVTANGVVQTEEEATVYVRELDLFVTVMLLEDTPAVLSLGTLFEDHGVSYHWTSGQKPHLTKKGKIIDLQYIKLCAIRSPWFIFEVPTTPTPTSSSSSRDSVFDESRYTENPVPERSGSTSVELRKDPLHKPTETGNKNKWRTRRSTKRSIAAAGVQREFGRWT